MSDEILLGREWWTQQWVDLLNSYRFKKRLERARDYARQGNVLRLDFRDGKFAALVQGTAPEPYEVSLHLDKFSDEEWDWAIETMAGKPIFAAKMLAGEMPPTIETEVFATNGLRLFPFRLSEVRSKCTCPDKANPCKHIAAVYYMLGDRFSEDPFVLFQLRGRTREEILARLRQRRGAGAPAPIAANELAANELATNQQVATLIPTSASTPPTTTVDLQRFWRYDDRLDSSLVAIAPAASNETVLEVLGDIPLPADDPSIPANPALPKTLTAALQEVYQQVSQQAAIAALSRA